MSYDEEYVDLFVFVFCFSDFAKQNATSNANQIEERILQFALNDSTSIEDFIKSQLLLSNLILTDAQILSLKNKISDHEKDTLRNMMVNYLLWNQTQEITYRNEFINYYPTGNNLINLNEAIRNCNYRIVGSPLQKTLAYFARNNKEALVKLIKSIPHLDGANADELSYQLQEVYNLDKNRFIDVSKELGVEIDKIIYKVN